MPSAKATGPDGGWCRDDVESDARRVVERPGTAGRTLVRDSHADLERPMTEPAAPVPAIENVWVVEATYAPDAAETRAPIRPAHLARIAALKAEGTIVEAGGFLDMSGSLLVVRAADEAAALDVVRQDVYMQHGVWVELRARAFGRVSAGD